MPRRFPTITKVWPHAGYPLIEVGELELNRNPENYFQDVEQAACNPANIVRGIGFSPDRMLLGRLFAYVRRLLTLINRGLSKNPGVPVRCELAAAEFPSASASFFSEKFLQEIIRRRNSHQGLAFAAALLCARASSILSVCSACMKSELSGGIF